MTGSEADDDALVEVIERSGRSIAVAESLTGGLLANRFARLPGASDWFRGGVVAYSRSVKEDLLGIGDAPVVSESAARAMAAHAAAVLGADVALAVTGVGGPDPQDGLPAGTVWIALHRPGGDDLAEEHAFAGDPAEVVDQTCEAAGRLLRRALHD
jgi:nicotinamide-nucleotide amidase